MLETATAIVIIVCLLSMIIPNNVQRIQNAQFQKTIAEMQTIAEASMDFYISQGSCPTGISQLAPTYMPQAALSSPFLSNYQLSCGSGVVSVSNLIPGGLAQGYLEGPLLQVAAAGSQDNITITKRTPYAFTARLWYDKKYLYNGS